MKEQMREAFEAWVATTNGNYDYFDCYAQGYQAALSAVPAQEPTEEDLKFSSRTIYCKCTDAEIATDMAKVRQRICSNVSQMLLKLKATGIYVESSDERSIHKARAVAMEKFEKAWAEYWSKPATNNKEAFEVWWHDFKLTHNEWPFADKEALLLCAYQAGLASQAQQPIEAKPYGYVTTLKNGTKHFYESMPYLDNAIKCDTVYLQSQAQQPKPEQKTMESAKEAFESSSIFTRYSYDEQTYSNCRYENEALNSSFIDFCEGYFSSPAQAQQESNHLHLHALKEFVEAWEACGKYPDTQAEIDALDEAYNLALSTQAQQESLDAKRLDFVLSKMAFVEVVRFDDTFNRYKLMSQNEDEEFFYLHDENKSFATEREAIDAAMSFIPPAPDGHRQVKDRFKIIEGSQSGHCCFEYTIVDTEKPTIVNGKDDSVCECFEKEQAELICKALNAYKEQ